MRFRVARTFVAVTLAGLSSAGCDSSTGNKERKLTLSVTSASLTVGQGSTTPVTMTIERANFDGPVTLTLEGALPAGVTATLNPNPLPTGTSSATLTIAVAPSVNPATATFSVRATADGVTDHTVAFDLAVTVTGTYTLGTLASTLRVAQGGGGHATVLVTRGGGNGGNVSLAVTGMPAGIGATFGQSTTTDRAVSLIVSASAAVAPGTYPVTITSSSPGLTPDQTTNLSIVVISPPTTTSISVPFCASDLPTWFAYQNEGYFWERVLPTGNRYNFSTTEKATVAFAYAAGNESEIDILYVSRTELAGLTDRDCGGARTYSGTVSGLTTGQSALVVMGASAVLASATTGAFTLSDVAERPLDLISTRGIVTQNAFLAPDRFIVRRGLDLASGTALPALDFTAAEAFAPASVTLTISGTVGGDLLVFQNTLRTVTSTYGTLQVANPVGTSASLYAVPANQLAATDLHELLVDASNASGSIGHASVEYFRDPADRTVALGPTMTTPSVTTISTTPFVRLRGLLAFQPEYPTVARFTFVQGSLGSRRFIVPIVSSAYLGATPTTWDVVIPDLSGTTGFNGAWMLSAGGISYAAEVFSGRGDLLFGALPVNGEVYQVAYRQQSTSTLARVRAAPAAPAAPFALTPQYLRR